MDAYISLGYLHWFRHLALPETDGAEDLRRCVELLVPCFLLGIEPIPELLPDIAVASTYAANDLLNQALDFPNPGLIAEVVRLWRRIVAAVPESYHKGLQVYRSLLGTALLRAFELERDPAMLDAGIQQFTEAHAAAVASGGINPDNPYGVGNLYGFAGALLTRYNVYGVDKDLADATARLEEAVDSGPAELSEPEVLFQVGLRLLEHAERLRAHDGRLDSAVTLLRAAMEATPTGLKETSVRVYALCRCLVIRHELTGATRDLEEAIAAARRGLDPDPERLVAATLALTLITRFNNNGDPDDVEEAVGLTTFLTAGSPVGETARPADMHIHGTSLRARYELAGDLDDLNAAITAFRHCVLAQPSPLPVHVASLGQALRHRFERTGDGSALDEAIELLRDAAEAAVDGSGEAATYRSSLGLCLLHRHLRTQDPAVLDEAIVALGQALHNLPERHANRPRFHGNLGIALCRRFQRTKTLGDIDEAIATYGAALRLTPPAHRRDKGLHEANRGTALLLRHELTGAEADLDQAITDLHRAATVTPVEQPEGAVLLGNLGRALTARHSMTGSDADRREAVSVLTRAAHAPSAAAWWRIQAAQEAARLAAEHDPALAAELLAGGVGLLPELASQSLHRSDQQDQLGNFSRLTDDAVALALTAGEATSDGEAGAQDYAVKALRLVETGRAVILGHALNTRSDLLLLRATHPELAHTLADLSERLSQATMSALPGIRSDTADDRHLLSAEFAATLHAIRTLEGFSSFLQPPESADELRSEAGQGPIVFVNVSSHRCDALLVTREKVTHLPLPALTHDVVLDMVDMFHEALPRTTAEYADRRERRAAQDTLSAVLRRLWDTAVGPILDALGLAGPPAPGEDWPQVWWAPGGILGLLPLHAAGYAPAEGEHRSALERVVSSYVPTLRALRHARSRPAPLNEAGKALIVTMPFTMALPELPHAQAESAAVRARTPRPVVLTGSTSLHEHAEALLDPANAPAHLPTKARVLEELVDASIAHFACHGGVHADDPSLSQLFLEDFARDPLSVASLASARLGHADLAYLSACVTALTGSAKLVNESIQLTTAFQLLGFRQVIGTLWPIQDRMAVEVADSFYRCLTTAGRLDTDRAAVALHQSVRLLRRRLPHLPLLWAGYIHTGA
ncbi:CHAT domain-containing protein [Streptomyces sp. NPDC057249]|uniref:CHAT domain-containing protein n=1 Tax=Streptomyces sp. NPDC057249 TaxID=3346067 RepID=UPI003640FFCD